MPLLFSYGTLQEPAVQLSTFGRLLRGDADELVGFEASVRTIDDPDFVATSGRAQHRVVTFTGEPGARVAGTVFEVSDREIEQSDAYEPAGYRRMATELASGREAWVYVGTDT